MQDPRAAVTQTRLATHDSIGSGRDYSFRAVNDLSAEAIMIIMLAEDPPTADTMDVTVSISLSNDRPAGAEMIQ